MVCAWQEPPSARPAEPSADARQEWLASADAFKFSVVAGDNGLSARQPRVIEADDPLHEECCHASSFISRRKPLPTLWFDRRKPSPLVNWSWRTCRAPRVWETAGKIGRRRRASTLREWSANIARLSGQKHCGPRSKGYPLRDDRAV